MLRLERNEFGYPVFDTAWPDFDRRRLREFLEHIAHSRPLNRAVAEDELVELERLWVDIGGEG